MSPDQASGLLDELVYERVLACIDVEELARFARELIAALDDVGVAEADSPKQAKDMVLRAVLRFRDELDASAIETSAGPPGGLIADDCPLCIDLARHDAEQAAMRKRKAAKAPSSS